MDHKLPNEKYIITMDEIDQALAALPMRLGDGNQTVPLWNLSSHRSNEQEYYEFEVYATMVHNEESNICDENKNKYMCNICNTEVPKIYVTEHNSSIKHRTCLAIADLAMERIRKHMAEIVPGSSNAEKDSSTYFCEPCALVVKVKNKSSHEKSVDHITSVKHDELCNYLLCIYTDKSNLEVGEPSEVDSKSTCTDLKSCKCTDNINVKTATEKIIAETVATDITVDLKDKGNQLENMWLTQNIDDQNVGSVQADHSLTPTDDENSMVSDEDCEWNSRNNDYEFYCRCCDTSIPQVGVRMHMRNTKHKELYAKNKHLYRHEITHKHMTSCRSLNVMICRLCDVCVPRNLEDITRHVESVAHELKYESVLASNTVYKVDGKLFCEACGKDVENLVVSHICGKKHLRKLRVFNKNCFMLGKLRDNAETFEVDSDMSNASCETTSVREMKKVVNLHWTYAATDDPNIFLCKVCKVNVEDNTTVLESHRKGENHLALYDSMLKKNKVVKWVKRKLICVICDVVLMIKDTVHHIDSNEHKSKIDFEEVVKPSKSNTNATEVDYLTVDSTREIHCTENTDVKMNSSAVSETANKPTEVADYLTLHSTSKSLNQPEYSLPIQNSIASEVYERNIDNVQSKHSQVPAHETNDNISYCMICDTNVKGAIEAHISDTKHKELTATNVYQDKISHTHMKHFEYKGVNVMICRVCNVIMPKNLEQAAIHIESDIHNLRYKSFLASNTIFICKDKRNCFCKTCGAVFLEDCVVPHINGRKHKNGLKIFNKNFPMLGKHQDDDDEDVATETFEVASNVFDTTMPSKTSSANAIKKSIYPHWTYAVTDDPNQYLCKVCKVNVESNTMKLTSHRRGEDHVARYETMLKENKLLKRVNNSLICSVCDVPVKKRDTIDHVKMYNHRNKLLILNRSICYVAQSAATNLQPIIKTEKYKNVAKVVNNKTQNAIANEEKKKMKLSKSEVKEKVNQNFNNLQTANVVKRTDSIENRPPAACHYTMKIINENPNMAFCKSCNVFVPNGKSNIEEHCKGSKHTSTFNSILHSNNMKKVDVENVFCEYCNLFIPNTHIFDHIKSSIHKVNEIYGTPSTSKNVLEVANAVRATEGVNSTAITEKQLISISKESKHDIKDIAITAHIKDEFVVAENALQVLCKVCRVNVSNTDKDMTEHLKTSQHISEYNIRLLNLSMFDVTEIHKELLCKACKVRLPNTDNNIRSHLGGAKHFTKYNDILTENYLKKVNDKIFCKCCNIDIDEMTVFDHINCNSHSLLFSLNNDEVSDIIVNSDIVVPLPAVVSADDKVKGVNVPPITDVTQSIPFAPMASDSNENDNDYEVKPMTKDAAQAICKTCNLITPTIPKQIFVKVKDRDIKADIGHFLLLKTETGCKYYANELICAVCNIKFPSTVQNFYHHLNSKKHSNNRWAIILDNNSKKLNDTLFCGHCEMDVLEAELIEHVNSDFHKSRLNAADESDVSTAVTENSDVTTENEAPVSFVVFYIDKAVDCNFCKSCQSLVPDVPKSVTNGEYNKVLFANTLNREDGEMFCESCENHVSEGKEFEHIESENHNIRYMESIHRLSIKYFFYRILTKSSRACITEYYDDHNTEFEAPIAIIDEEVDKNEQRIIGEAETEVQIIDEYFGETGERIDDEQACQTEERIIDEAETEVQIIDEHFVGTGERIDSEQASQTDEKIIDEAETEVQIIDEHFVGTGERIDSEQACQTDERIIDEAETEEQIIDEQACETQNNEPSKSPFETLYAENIRLYNIWARDYKKGNRPTVKDSGEK